MKKIQPFTIGTKLSIPTGAKCQGFEDIILSAPGLDSCKLKSNLNDKMLFFHHQEQPRKHYHTAMEDCPEEEKDFLYSSASSRSIKKIAICGSTRTEGDCGVVDTCITTYEHTQRHNSTEKTLEEKFVDSSLPHPELESWRTMNYLQYDYGITAFPLEHPDDVPPIQQRDLKDFENSHIQLTTSLDLKKDEPKRTSLKKLNTPGLCKEICERRHSIGEHIDKLWLKFRSFLQNYQQDLMLALDVSSFYQHADIIISTINSKRSSFHVANVQDGINEKENREMATQIKMLNKSAAQLSNLHPTLASRVTRKQAEVKESWALLQDAFQNQRAAISTPTTSSELQYFEELEIPGVMVKDVKEENNLRESEEPWIYRMLSPLTECSSGFQVSQSESSSYEQDNTKEKQIKDSERKDQQAVSDSFTQQKLLKLCELLTDSTTLADQVTWLKWLKNNTPVQSGENKGHLKQFQEHNYTEIVELLGQVEVLWDGLRKIYGHAAEVEPAEREFLLTDDVAEQAVLKLPHSNCPPESVEEYSFGMLAKFLQLLDHEAMHEMHQVITYLCMTDSLKAADRPSEMFSTSEPLFSQCSSSSLSNQVLSGFLTLGFQLPATSASFTVPLKQKKKKKESHQMRHTTLGIVRSDNSLMSQSIMSSHSFRERANTWPEGDKCGKKHQTSSEHQVFSKKHSVNAICTNKPNPVNILSDFQTMAEAISDPNKNVCSYLSLGSTLSFSLPQDFRVLHTSAANPQSSEEEKRLPFSSVLIDSYLLQALPAGSSNITLNQIPQSALEVQSIIQELQGKSNHHTVHVLDELILEPNNKSEKKQHDNTQQRAPSQGTMDSTKEFYHWEMGVEQDMEQHTSGEQSSEFKELLTAVGHMPTTTFSNLTCSNASSCSHKCLSVHTKIKDLNGHLYHASKYMCWSCDTNSVLFEIKHLPNQLTDSKLGSNKSNRVVFCGERECTVCCNTLEEQSPAALITEDKVKVSVPFCWQFQEKEKELDNIWSGTVDDVASDWAVDKRRGLSTQIDKGPLALSLHG